MSVNENFPLALPEGTVLAGQYTIEAVLGQGGFGITYRANDHKSGQKVAIKEFFPDTLAYRDVTKVISYPGERSENFDYGKETFLQEAKTLAAFIGCENIVRIHSYFEENQTAYFVMDYIEGISFDRYIKQNGGKISCEDAKRILIPVMDALAVVHSKGIIHRDVTPDNIYITNDGTVKLLDFGAARYSLGDKSRSLDVILKHGFAPKEQYTRRGKQGPFTDIYSLGATFYFALTGRRPPDSVDRLEEDDLVPPSTFGVMITDYEEQAILQAMSVQPYDRFQSMTAFKNVFMNEAASAPAASPVQQQFFSAPANQPVMQAAPQQAYVPSQQEYAPTQMPSQQEYAPTQFPSQQFQQNAAQPQQEYAPTQFPSQQYQQGYNPSQQQYVQDPSQQTYVPQPAAGKKPLNKKAIIISAAAVGVLGIATAIIVPAVNSSKSHNNNIVASETISEYVEAPVSDAPEIDQTPPAFPDISIPEIPSTTAAVTTTAAPAPSPTVKAGDANIVGSAGNIMCGGLVCGDYYIDNYLHDLKNTDGTKIFENLDGQITNLCYSDGLLFFHYTGDNKIHFYDTYTGENHVASELEKYVANSNSMRLYVSKDYWFVYMYDSSLGMGKIYRVRKETGEEEQWVEVGYESDFTFANGNLYYIKEDNSGLSSVVGVSATDFSEVIDNYFRLPEGFRYTCVTADTNDVLYTISMSDDDKQISIQSMTNDLVTHLGFWDISSVMPSSEGARYRNVTYLTAYDNNFVFNVSYMDSNSIFYYKKIYAKGFSDGTIKTDVVTPLTKMETADDWLITFSSLLPYNGNTVEVDYISISTGRCCYRIYDSSGNIIEN